MFEVEIFPGALELNTARVELYADGINGGAPECLEYEVCEWNPDASGRLVITPL